MTLNIFGSTTSDVLSSVKDFLFFIRTSTRAQTVHQNPLIVVRQFLLLEKVFPKCVAMSLTEGNQLYSEWKERKLARKLTILSYMKWTTVEALRTIVFLTENWNMGVELKCSYLPKPICVSCRLPSSSVASNRASVCNKSTHDNVFVKIILMIYDGDRLTALKDNHRRNNG